MASTYKYPDELLDFDDTNNFLRMLQTTVPSIDREWDFEVPPPLEIPDLLFVSEMNPGPSGMIKPDPYLAPESLGTTLPDQVPVVDFSEAAERMMSFSLVSGSDLAGSHFAGSSNGTPNTSVSSPHTTPENLPKKEPVLPFSPSMFSRNVTTGSDFGSDTADVLSPRLKVLPKDKVAKPAKKTKVSHNMIEKKYRTNINSKILELRDAVPTLRIAAGKDNVRVTDLDGLTPASKLNKASVLTKATEYIKHLERKNDFLAKQIALLQTAVRDTSVNNSTQLTQRRQTQASLVPEANLEYGFNQNQQFGSANYVGYNQPELQNLAPQQHSNVMPMDSNLLLGGMATVLGGSLITGENFRGMAAVPFFPGFLSSPSVTTLQALPVIRAAVIFSGLAMLSKPICLLFVNKDKKQKSQSNVWVSWMLSSLRLQSPLPSSDTNSRIVTHLLGRTGISLYQLLKDYASLSPCEVTFENCFLQVLLGVMIVKRLPHLSKLIKGNIRWKASLLKNLQYSGDDSDLLNLSMLVKDVDGLSLFESESMLTRLENIFSGNPINKGIVNGDNNTNYADAFLKNRNNIYSIILNWRILELIYEINLSYLESFAMESDKKDDCVADVQKDIMKLDEFLLSNNTCLQSREYFYLFRSVVNPETTPELYNFVKSKISNGVRNIDALINGPELTDDEKISDDESLADDDGSSNSTAKGNDQPEDLNIEEHRSIIYSTNMMNEEKFIALVSSVFFYTMETQGDQDPLKQLHLLKFKDSDFPLSLLSFTCLIKILCLSVKDNEKEEDDDDTASDMDAATLNVLDSIIKMIRNWLNDDAKEQFLSHSLRSELTELTVSKGESLNL